MLKLAALNAMEPDEFTSTLAGIFEHSPWIADRTFDKRPFRSVEHLHAALCQTVVAASDAEKLGLIRAHPDLVGHALLTAESKAEQTAAGLGELSAAEIAEFQKYNAEYQERFGFPFVICARLNKKDAILAAFPIRLRNDREQEIGTALQEIFKIAGLRLKDVWNE